MEASEAPPADPSELPAAEPCPEEETLPVPSSDAQPLTTPPAPSPVALSVSLTPATASAPIPPPQPQSQLSQQQRPPVAAKTRPQNHLGQPPLTPLSSAPPSSSSSYPTIQRSGLAMGVPALLPHHTRQPSQVGYSLGASHFSQPFMNSSSPSSSFSQPFSGYPRGSMSLSEQSSGSVVPSPPFSQPFSAMPRSTAGMPEQQSNSNSQLKPPVPGVQTIGMIGSLSGSSRMRAGGIQHQQRLGQPIDKSIPQSGTNQSQKFPNPGLSRPTSMPSANAPISALQTAQSLQQQWMPNPGKQSHGTSFPSSSFRPQTKQHMLQQRPQSPQHQQQQQQQSPSVAQNQLQISSSQQHQKQHHQQQKQLQQHQQLQQQNISMPHHLPDLHSNKNQQSLQQQHLQASRSHASITQRSNNQSGQPVLLHPGITSPITEGTPETCNRILSKRSIQELVAQIDPHEKLEPEVEDVLVEIADDFVESITKAACSLAKHRRSTTLEAKDILLHVERNWNITLPGFGGDEVKLYKKPYTNDIHKERLAMIRKSIGIASDSGITKNVGSGHAAVNSKTHASRASAPAASSPKAS